MIQNLTIAGKSALGYFPSNYDPTKAYPCEVFLPGLGETGTPGTSKLLVNGPFASGGIQATTDLGLDLIVIAIEPNEAYGIDSGGKQAAGYLAAIAAAYKISKFYLSGLSLGCQEWMNFLWQPGEDLSMIGGLFMLSADPANVAPYGTSVITDTIFDKLPIFYYGGCGTSDPMYGMQYPIYLEIANVSPAPLIPPAWDSWAGAGHGNPVWSNFWSLTWVSPSMGMTHWAKIAQLSPVSVPAIIPPAQTPASVVLTTATPAQLATTTPTSPTVYINPITKTITVWNGTVWQ